ncbi:Por secretion system C-terminal sorting domain-containing protein [Lishizhenia tianjinensis]|uniref:Por secretion system C-terminal sorting domain-containing protein n=1 Tax=Lishizhenia tianjinensis TaxID=477690 RepID=A0A1I6Y4A2_9FLAO|nr:two-component regulator propeller domain-containing protein [Lishizhenia tianjinensis]SFT44944.1 Por secretion system C-terminal sorting domain-containing protein [Lishizhenia tianjinensis]
MIKITLISLCTLLYIGAHAQNSNWTNLVYEANKANHIFPDGDDIYISTNAGYTILDRTSGNQMEYDFTTMGLVRSKVFYIHGDGMGKHWFNNEGRTFTKEGSNWQYHPSNFPYNPINNIKNIRYDSQGNMWYLAGALLVKYDGSNYHYFDQTNSPLVFNMMSNPKFEIDGNDNVWITDYNKGLFKYDGNSFTLYTRTNSDLPSNKLNALTILDNGDVYLATGDSGVVVFNGTTFNNYSTTNSALHNNEIHEIKHHGNTVFGISGGYGIWSEILKIENAMLSMYNASNAGLPLKTFDKLAVDDEGTLWFQSNSGDQHTILEFDGTYLTTHQLKNSPLVSNNIKDVCIGEEGEVRFLNEQAGSSLTDLMAVENNQFQTLHTLVAQGGKMIDHANGTFVYGVGDEVVLASPGTLSFYSSSNSDLSPLGTKIVAKDVQGNLWFAADDGLVKYDGNTLNLEYSFTTGVVMAATLRAFTIDVSGNFWMIVSNSNGRQLVQFDGTNYTVYDSNHPGLTDDNFKQVQASENGDVYMLSESGNLIKYDGSSFTYLLDLNTIDPYNDVTVLRVFLDQVWMGSNNREIIYYDGNNAQVFKTTNSPLLSNRIHGFAKDNAGNVWIATDQGISIYNENLVALHSEESLNNVLEDKGVHIYPNPCSDRISVQLNSGEEGSRILFYNAQGAMIRNVDLHQMLQDVQINHEPGIYFYRIVKDGKLLHQGRLIKK